MTKKNFIAFAKVLSNNEFRNDFKMLVKDLCAVFEKDNPYFNKVTFLKAVYDVE